MHEVRLQRLAGAGSSKFQQCAQIGTFERSPGVFGEQRPPGPSVLLAQEWRRWPRAPTRARLEIRKWPPLATKGVRAAGRNVRAPIPLPCATHEADPAVQRAQLRPAPLRPGFRRVRAAPPTAPAARFQKALRATRARRPCRAREEQRAPSRAPEVVNRSPGLGRTRCRLWGRRR